MKEIQNKIWKADLVEWKSLKVLQPKNLKEISTSNFENYKESLLRNQFVCSFLVWEDEQGDLFILDSRYKLDILHELENEGVVVPAKFPANFVLCKNRQEAAELVLVFSSIYAKLTEQGILDFIELSGIDLEELGYLSLPSIESRGILDSNNITKMLDEESEEGDEKPTKKKTFKFICQECSFAW